MTSERPSGKRLIIAYILMALLALVLIAAATAKLTLAQMVVTELSKTGLGYYVRAIGAAELIFVVLFLIPSTRKLGFLLLTAHLGGAIATEIALHNPPVSAVLMAVLWIAAFLWDQALFLPRPAQMNPVPR